MLSATNSVNDVKTRLRKGFAFFGFADDTAYIAEITNVLDTVKFKEMIPYLSEYQLRPQAVNLVSENNVYAGEAYYNYIAAKDKVSLTLEENYIYRAEIAFACSEFMDRMAKDERFGAGNGITIPGFSEPSGSAGSIGASTSLLSGQFYDEALGYMLDAGYKVMGLKRGGRG